MSGAGNLSDDDSRSYAGVVPPRGGKWLWGGFIVVMVYVLSIGPACWISMRLDPMRHGRLLRVTSRAYTPVVWGLILGPRPLKDVADWYVGLGAPTGTTVIRGDYDGIYWDRPGSTYTFLGR